jgi:hypothetical protein
MFAALGGGTLDSFATAVSNCYRHMKRLRTWRIEVDDLANALEQVVQV